MNFSIRLLHRILKHIAKLILSSAMLQRNFKRILLKEDLLERMLDDKEIREKIRLDEAENIFRDEEFLSTFEFIHMWKKLKNIIKLDKIDINRQYKYCKRKAKDKKDVNNLLLNIICEDNKIFLSDGIIKFSDCYSLWALIHEILIQEEYYFESNTDTPRILDCGTHFGLAIYYYKSLYPKAKITGFEPVHYLRNLALENIRINDYHDVEILPYALSNTDSEQRFWVSQDYTMAGSLTKRRSLFGDNLREIIVECRRLSEYLDEAIHFLKLDVEGVEDTVLFEAEPWLHNVQHICCEYHHGFGLASDRLGNILMLLDRVGFDVHVGKSLSYHDRSMHKPMSFVTQPYSVLIWGKNRSFKT